MGGGIPVNKVSAGLGWNFIDAGGPYAKNIGSLTLASGGACFGRLGGWGSRRNE